jgi:hypothetical protein
MKMEMKESGESAREACLRKELKHMKSFPLLVKVSRTMDLPQKKELRHIKSYKSSARRRHLQYRHHNHQNNVNASHGP